MNSSLTCSSQSAVTVWQVITWSCLIGLLGSTSIVVQVQSIYWVSGTGSSSAPTYCQGSGGSDDINYESGVCYNQSSTSFSHKYICGPDGFQSYTLYADSNCTRVNSFGNITAGSINKCMPMYYYNYQGALTFWTNLMLVCDGAGTPVTDEPQNPYNTYADSFPLSSDAYVTNVQYWSNANCSGEPLTTYANLTNGACITNLTYLDPGAGVRFTCMIDPLPYSSGGKGNVQYVEAWAGQPTTCSTFAPMRGWNGYRTQNNGHCMTLWNGEIASGSYKFICPSFMPAPVSSSSSSSSGVSISSSTSPISSSSSGPSSLQSSSSTATSSTAPTPTASSSTGTSGDVSSTGLASDSIGMASLLLSPWLIASLIILQITLRY